MISTYLEVRKEAWGLGRDLEPASRAPEGMDRGSKEQAGERSDSWGRELEQGSLPATPAPLVEAGPATRTILPRRLLLRLPVPTLALWQSASKPRIPPTPSPISTTWGRGQRGQEGLQQGQEGGGGSAGKFPPGQPLTPDLPAEAGALRGAQEGRIGLVGAGDDCGHGTLVSG